jgi:ubiquinone/menaquinone biosynthesis C-methylase UbiE
MSEGVDWSATFNEVFATPFSAVEAKIWGEVYGTEYPAEVEPYSYVTRTELAAMLNELDLSNEHLLIDIGCGRGGPGLWVAAQSRANLLGIDIASTAVTAATANAAALGMSDVASFLVGCFESIPAEDSSAQGAMSIDALLFSTNKAAAIGELARVLRPGGRFVATTWDYHSQPIGRPPQVPDHRPLLQSAGFEVVLYEETQNWESNQRRIIELLLANVDELAAESGEDPDVIRTDISEMATTIDTMIRRVFIVAMKI